MDKPSILEEYRQRVPRFVSPTTAKATTTTYRISQSLLCGIMARSVMSESQTLAGVRFRLESLSSIMESIHKRQWLGSLRQHARDAGGGELGKVLFVLADSHLTDCREARQIMDAFDDLGNTLEDPSSLRTYPSRQEMECEQAKFQD